ncbi:peptidoglycan N-acetylglucosamine deacetylase [Clostridium sp. chh4-2]|uniref:polysaccharide deacetylase family protein n=1 Tax=Clostridium sp. chh4-2 TaxID=2067550 RepID=UPI000CCE5F75|nr:polysaccharide deacetylase family protein [Clostridium sp. chh4-2]PNV60058.1 peptidoglycan N-acetylglucosamine deacetylase [Clostridium sp. chh4-2]
MADKKRWMMRLLFGAAAFVAAYFVVYYGDIFNIKREGIFENAFTLDVNGEGTVVKEQKLVALTFDDGPHPVYTKRLLDGLKKRNVNATFFLIGASIEGNEEIVRQMKEDGHLIGNHSHTHVQLTAEDTQKACEEIDMTNQKIFEITGEYPTYIRPPYGSWSEELECMVPMTVVLWDIDPLDWKYQSSQRVVKHILKYVEDNSIILLHDVYGSSVDAALEVIDTLTAQGYTFVTVDELLID